MKQQSKKRLALILAVAVLATAFVLPSLVSAADYRDIHGHWAQDVIGKWSSYGVIQGYDGLFRPDENITRAEVAQVTQNVIGYNDMAINSFYDLDSNQWYAQPILKLVAAGTLTGDADGAMRPNDNMTREEAITMLSRAFFVNPVNGFSTGYSDAAQISEYAILPINAMASRGFINGYADGGIHPKATITRAEFIKIIDNMIQLYVTSNNFVYPSNITGVAMIKCGDIYFSNARLSNVLISPQAFGTITFSGCTIDNLNNLSNAVNIQYGGSPAPVPTYKPTPTIHPGRSYYSVDFYNGGRFYATSLAYKNGRIKEVPDAPVRAGATFVGWYTTASAAERLNERYRFNVYTDIVTEDMNLYAGYKNIPAPEPSYVEISSVTINHQAPYVGDTLIATVYPSEARGRVNYYWYRNSASAGQQEITYGTSNRYKVTNEDANCTITVRVEALPGEDCGGVAEDTTSQPVASDNYYDINVVGDEEHCTFRINPPGYAAQEGDNVTLTIIPDSGYKLRDVRVSPLNGPSLNVRKLSETEYSFTMPNSSVLVELNIQQLLLQQTEEPQE